MECHVQAYTHVSPKKLNPHTCLPFFVCPFLPSLIQRSGNILLFLVPCINWQIIFLFITVLFVLWSKCHFIRASFIDSSFLLAIFGVILLMYWSRIVRAVDYCFCNNDPFSPFSFLTIFFCTFSSTFPCLTIRIRYMLLPWVILTLNQYPHFDHFFFVPASPFNHCILPE